MRAHLILLPALAAMAVCQPAASPAAEAAPAAGPVEVSVDNDLYSLEYSWPAAAGDIPALRAWLEGDLTSRRAKLIADATEDRDEVQRAGYPYRPHGLWVAWQVVTQTPGWLSLSADISTYSGGAHPNHWSGALLWDKRRGERRDALDLFSSKEALSAAIRKDFCRAIDRQRQKKRGEPAIRPDDFFGACLDPVDYTVILGSSNRKAFNRIGVLVPPYEAGPYAEGSYEVTLPVTPAILATVRPEYRESFALMR